MGSPGTENCRNALYEAQHSVTLTHAFELGTTEVTQGEFESVLGYNPAYFGPSGAGADCGLTCPVENVTWHEAVAYCNALSTWAGVASCYTCTGSGASVSCQEAAAYSGANVYTCPGYRLPTEAEFERAYRGGTTTAFYNGGATLAACGSCATADANAGAIAWYCQNAGGKTHPAKGKLANAYNLYDMAGNVWEWCHDWYTSSSLGTSAVTDPWGLSSGTTRVCRGGAWNQDTRYERAAARPSNTPGTRSSSGGFRCARSK